MFMPQSPRWLMDNDREEDSRNIIASLRRLDKSHPLVELEFLELKAQKVFEKRLSEHDFPEYQGTSFHDRFMLGLKGYQSLLTNRSNFKRLIVAVMIMV